ncbi:MAG: zf-HC2 domain-containing protein [Myxococcota bacterium]
MSVERTIAGIRCSEVLECLAAFLEGELPPSRVDAIKKHLAGCDQCSRFGEEYAKTVARLRSVMAEPAALDADAVERLRARVRGQE